MKQASNVIAAASAAQANSRSRFLLDDDAAGIIGTPGMDFIRPAPYFDVCDNLGRFYVMVMP